jgi:Tfp pilus assembly protein PilO
MDKTAFIRKLLNKPEVKDYTSAFLFFLISSVFALFAIKPAISIAFSLNKQAADLHKVDQVYEQNLGKLVELQTNLEKIQDKTYLLDQALPKMPETKTFIDDIKRVSSQEGILIEKLDLSSVDLKNDALHDDIGVLSVSMQTTSNFKSIDAMVNKLIQQKRIKSIKNMKITTESTESSGSATLNVTLDIEAYYL